MSFTPQEQPSPVGQDQQVTPDPTPAAVAPPAPAAPSPAPGPWSQDLASAFQDESQRAAVDQFLREKVQPYTTQLEQKANVSEQATNLWKNFEDDPINTYVGITYELLGEEAATQVLEAAQRALANEPDQQVQQQAPPQQQAADPRTENLLNWAEQQQVEQYYQSEMQRVSGAPENADLANMKDVNGQPVLNHIHPFVATAGGDWDQAVGLMRNFIQQFGVPQIPDVPTPETVPVLGSDTATTQPSTTPTEPRKQTLDEALNEFMVEQREARQAPPMGAV